MKSKNTTEKNYYQVVVDNSVMNSVMKNGQTQLEEHLDHHVVKSGTTSSPVDLFKRSPGGQKKWVAEKIGQSGYDKADLGLSRSGSRIIKSQTAQNEEDMKIEGKKVMK